MKCLAQGHNLMTWPQCYKTVFMLKSIEREIYPAHNAYWHFNIYKQNKYTN